MGGQLITPGYWGQGNAQGNGSLIQPYSNTGSGSTLINPYLPTSQASFQFWLKPVFTASDGTLWSPGVEGATYASNPWDYIYLGIPSTQPFTPGLCRVHLRRERAMDKKKPVGSDGARITFHGVDAAEFDIEIRIWTPEQLKALANLWVTLFPPAYKGPPPNYDVQHPMFSVHGVKAAQFVAGEGPEIGPDRTGMFRIRAVEYLKPSTKKAVTTSVGPIGSLLDPGAYPTPGNTAANRGP